MNGKSKRNYKSSAKTLTKGATGLTGVQKKQVTRILTRQQELKYVLSNAAGQNTSAAGVFYPITDIVVGPGDSQRIGDSVMLAGRIDLKVNFQLAAGALADNTNLVRVFLFQWHPNSVPTANNLFLPGASGAVDIYSLYSHDNRQLFNVFFDKTFKLVGNALTANTPNTTDTLTDIMTFKIPLSKLAKKVQFVGGGLGGTNKIYMGFISDSGVPPHPAHSFSLKLVYRDS